MPPERRRAREACTAPIAVDDALRAGPVVVAAGDAVVGASLVVNAIADGRRAAATCDRLLQVEAAVAV